MAKHAKLCPPSGWDRWSVCSFSVDVQTNEGSEYAALGTAAHLLGDTCFRQGLKAEDFLGQSIWIPDAEDDAAGERERFLDDGTDAPLTGWVFEVDHEMADNVQTYMDQVLMQPRDYLQSETEVPIGHVTTEEDATGHADAIRIHGTTLATHDLKYGQGVKVFAKDNGQQVLYLLGAVREFDWYGQFDKFEVHIHQPRLGHHDVWYLSKEELELWAKRINKIGYAIVKEGKREFGPSTKGCKFCDYRKECDARRTMAATTPDDFPVYDVDEEDPGAWLVEALERVEFVEAWAKDVWALATQVAKEKPGSIPGWDMFPGRGSRVIKDEKLLKGRLRKKGFKIDQYMPRKMLSAAQVEKLVGKQAYKDWVSDVIEHKDGTPKLGRQTGDRKPARSAEALGFSDIGDE